MPADPAGEVPLQARHRGGNEGIGLAHGRAEGRVRLPRMVAPRWAELKVRAVAARQQRVDEQLAASEAEQAACDGQHALARRLGRVAVAEVVGADEQ